MPDPDKTTLPGKRLSLRLTPELSDKIDILKERTGCHAVSDVLRFCINEMIQQFETPEDGNFREEIAAHRKAIRKLEKKIALERRKKLQEFAKAGM